MPKKKEDKTLTKDQAEKKIMPLKKDLLYSVKNELGIENEDEILPRSDLSQISPEHFPSLEEQSQKSEKIKLE